MDHANVSARALVAVIPSDCLKPRSSTAFGYLCRDLALFFLAAWAVLVVDQWALAIPLAILMGSALTGIFVVGHDCGHRSFSTNTRINDAVGEFATSLTLWPYQVWRLSHDIHHRHTQNIEKDVAWVPLTEAKFRRLSAWPSIIYCLTRGPLFFIGSMFFTYYLIKDALRGNKSRHFNQQQLPLLRRSLWITLILGLAYVASTIALGGLYGFVFLFLLPQLVFHVHLSTYTLLHHTHPDSRFLADQEWTFAKGQLYSTVHVRFPRWMEWMNHDINWHVPHHVCVGIPHYHLRRAHAALATNFPPIKVEKFGLSLLRRVVGSCQYVKSKEVGGLDWCIDKKPKAAPQVAL